ncbi:hypothetical protein [Pseudoneobacillus sp. C159]
MRLSRVKKYKTNKRRKNLLLAIQQDPQKVLTKVIIASTITGTALFSTTIAFADSGFTGYLKRWYSERLAEVEEHLTTSIEVETTNQKAILLKKARVQTEQSIAEIQDYAASIQTSVKKNIETRAEETIEAIQSNLQSDMESTKKLIDESIPSATEDQNGPDDEKDQEIREKSDTVKPEDQSKPIEVRPVEDKK